MKRTTETVKEIESPSGLDLHPAAAFPCTAEQASRDTGPGRRFCSRRAGRVRHRHAGQSVISNRLPSGRCEGTDCGDGCR